VARAGPIRYRLLRTVYVPGCPLSLGDLRSAAARLDDQVRTLAAATGAIVVDQPGEWYGFDSIHVRRRRLDDLWGAVCIAWGLPAAAAAGRGPRFVDWAVIGSRAAEVRSLAGRTLRTPQPAIERSGLRVWLF